MANTVYPIATIINIAEISQFLASDDVSKTYIFKGGPPPVQRLPRLIYIVRRSVEWLYNIDPTNTTLPLIANYLLWLCGKYINQALTILGLGGSGSIINPSGGAATSLTGEFLQFKVGDVGSPMTAGETELTITANNPIANTVSVVLDGIELPQDDNTQVSYTVVYSTTSVVITFNQAVSNGQLYQVRFLRFVPL